MKSNPVAVIWTLVALGIAGLNSQEWLDAWTTLALLPLLPDMRPDGPRQLQALALLRHARDLIGVEVLFALAGTLAADPSRAPTRRTGQDWAISMLLILAQGSLLWGTLRRRRERAAIVAALRQVGGMRGLLYPPASDEGKP